MKPLHALMRDRPRSVARVAMALLAMTLVCSATPPAGACSCVGGLPERLTLDIESVTIDGAPVADLSEWNAWRVVLEADRDSDGVRLLAEQNDLNHAENFSRVR